MKQIKVWQTSDGKLFENHQEACTHEKDFSLRVLVRKLLHDLGFTASTENTIIKFIYDNQDELFRILKHWRIQS